VPPARSTTGESYDGQRGGWEGQKQKSIKHKTTGEKGENRGLWWSDFPLLSAILSTWGEEHGKEAGQEGEELEGGWGNRKKELVELQRTNADRVHYVYKKVSEKEPRGVTRWKG